MAVPILPDAHDEGAETLSLELSRPYGAVLGRASATGTITNEGPIPKAWTARFARAFAEQSVEAVQWRFVAARRGGLSGTLAGHAVGPGAEVVPAFGVDTWTFDSAWAGTGAEPESEDIADLVERTSLSIGTGRGRLGDVSVWARGSVTRFEAPEAATPVDGKISTGFLGIDAAGERLLGGVMLSEGVRTGRIDQHRFVELATTNAARLYGLYPRKGTIAIGADADMAIWDPDREVPVTHDLVHDNAGYTPYVGMQLTGWPVTVLSRGRVVVDDGELDAERGSGKFLACDRPALARPLGRLVPELDPDRNFGAILL